MKAWKTCAKPDSIREDASGRGDREVEIIFCTYGVIEGIRELAFFFFSLRNGLLARAAYCINVALNARVREERSTSKKPHKGV